MQDLQDVPITMIFLGYIRAEGIIIMFQKMYYIKAFFCPIDIRQLILDSIYKKSL